MHIGGMGTMELLVILAVALLIFGPKNLPKLGAAIGKTVKNVRRGMASVEDDSTEFATAERVDDQDKGEGAGA